ncbi:MAG TPA: heat-inducible transcriptional repressor HrcA [Candidatus Dormibacteraeota bacterium]|nr:heat-inducible transcriptional repressor HrcA [Candidatus Dormibacteraeota bacterium]
MLRDRALHERRNQQVLVDVVRTYIETGEPVSSRSISRRHEELLSPATIRSIMADLEDAGYLYQPHTSAGRLPTAAAYRFFAQQVALQATLNPQDREWIHREISSAANPEEMTERAGHVLAAISQGLGIVVSPPLGRTILEHMRFLLLPDGRVVVVLITVGGGARDKILRPERRFTQEELDRTAEYLNGHYKGWTVEAIRSDLVDTLAQERERYDEIVRDALDLCDPVLSSAVSQQLYVEGAARIAAAPEFADQTQLRELLAAIEEKHKLVALLNGCIEGPEPLYVQIGIDQMNPAGQNLALISAPYAGADQLQGSLGVLGPLRMQYERAMTAVAYVAQLLGETHNKT